MVSLLLQQTLVVSRDLSSQLLFSFRQEVHPRLTLLEETLLLEQHRLQFTGEGQRGNWNINNINIEEDEDHFIIRILNLQAWCLILKLKI